jgi:hypothetical protein
MGVSGQCHALAALYPGTHWIGGWVGPRAGLDENFQGMKEIENALNSTKKVYNQKLRT